MEKIDDITAIKIKKDLKTLEVDSYDSQDNLLMRLMEEDFHHNIILGLTQNYVNCIMLPDPHERRLHFATHDAYLQELSHDINLEMDSIYAYIDVLDRIYFEDHGRTIFDELRNPSSCYAVEKFHKRHEGTPTLQELLKDLVNNAIEYHRSIKDFSNYEKMRKNILEYIELFQNSFNGVNLSFDDAVLRIDKMLTELAIRLEATKFVIRKSAFTQSISYPPEQINEARTLEIKRSALVKLFADFDRNWNKQDKLGSQYIFDKIHFDNVLQPIKLRNKYWHCNSMLISTHELERYILMNIINFAPFQMNTFIEFLINNKIMLPLYFYKKPIYLDAFIHYDNRTINHSFCIESNENPIDMNSYRKQTLDENSYKEISKHLIRLTPNVK